MPLITEDDLAESIQVSEIARFKRGSLTAVAEAIETAEDRFKSAALNVYTAASYAALTPATLTAEARRMLAWDAIAILAGGNNTNEQIRDNAAEAAKFRSLVATGHVHRLDDVLTRISATSGGVKAIRADAEKTFDRNNVSQGFSARDELI